MDLRKLGYFVAVAEELHFGKAAARLGMTQPPLSQAILALEEEIGVKLLARSKRSVELTPAGAQWLPHVKRLLAEAEDLPHLAQRLARGETGSLSLAFVSTADYSVLPQLVGRFTDSFPEVELQLREATSDLQIDALLAGEIDAGLIIAPAEATLHPSLAYQALHREPLCLAVPSARLKQGRLPWPVLDLSIQDILHEPLILFPRRSAPRLHDLITGLYAKHDLRPRVGQEAIQMQTILSLVSGGLGVALVPASLKNLGRAGVEYIALRDDPPLIETGLLWRREAVPPALAHFIATARDLFADPDAVP